MTATKMRFLIVVALLATVAVFPIAARGAIISNPVSTADGTLIGGGDWESGVSLGWSVTASDGGYLYSYEFVAPGPALSHFELEISGNFTESDILDISPGSYEIDVFSAGPSKPGWPEGEALHAIKFYDISGESPFFLTLLSDRAPMEGDFYAKGGRDSFAFNSGFGSRDGANILVPDTKSAPVPEPGTLLLVGSGLMGIASLGRKRFGR